MVHEGVTNDIEVDTTRTDAMACARAIAAHTGRAAPAGHRNGS